MNTQTTQNGLKQNTLTKWVRTWGAFKGLKVQEDKSNGKHWVRVGNDEIDIENPF